MRPEKEFLVDAVAEHLGKSDYVYLADYSRITVAETAQLRDLLAKEGAEFHVVKNSILNVAAQRRELPDLKEHLNGPIAIIVGGGNPSGVAKTVRTFFEQKDKVELKCGVLADRALSREEILQLANLPSLEVLQAQLLGLLSRPASLFVQVLAAVPRSMVQVLQAKADKEGAVAEA